MFPKGKSHYFKCINKDAWDLYPVVQGGVLFSKTLHCDYINNRSIP